MKTELIRAALGVAEGLHEAMSSCWECGKFEATNQCGKCGLAVYCCRDCQVAAFRQGHRTRCATLKWQNDAFMKSLAIVDDIHKNDSTTDLAVKKGTMTHGMRLSDVNEYETAVWLHKTESLYVESVPGPSMEIFYENLGKVARGEWWLLPPTDCLDEYRNKVKGDGREYGYFRMISALLAYDYFAFVAAINDGIASDAKSVTNVCAEKRLFAPLLNDYGAAMPAGRFLELYRQQPVSTSSTDRSRLRRQCRTQFMAAMRNRFHK